jgi:hypothetical protein
MNSLKHPKKNEIYSEILEKPFIFNLHTVSTTRRRCRSSDVVGCEREAIERFKKVELSMKLLDDPKIPIARRNPCRPHHSNKPLDVAIEMGLKPGRSYCMRRCHHRPSATPTNLDPQNGEQSPQSMGWSPPTTEGRDPPRLYGPNVTETGRSAVAPARGRMRSNRLGSCMITYGCNQTLYSSYCVLL